MLYTLQLPFTSTLHEGVPMETKEMNEKLTLVGAGTPMGELLRRYWWPIAASAELVENPIRSVRILGEDLTLYKDEQGRVGLVGQRCPHRRMDLQFGIPELEGLRCAYHGWMFDQTGQCIEMPAEPEGSTFKDRVRIPAYPAEELGGLVFAYLGPAPAPLLPKWDLYVMDHVVRQIGVSDVPCNWLQCMENSVDQVHTEWLHGHMYWYQLKRKGIDPGTRSAKNFLRQHKKTAFEPFEYGILKRRLVEGQPEESEEWRFGHPLVFPDKVRIGGAASGRYEFQIRVPVDDTHTRHYSYQCYDPGPGVELPKQDVIPYFDVPLKDEEGNYIFDYILSLDMVAWWAQGLIVDRDHEKLGESDKGGILFRRMLKQQMDVVAQGGEPMNVFRDPAQNDYIRLAPDVSKLTPEEALGFQHTRLSFTTLRDGPTGRYGVIYDQLEELGAGRTQA